MQTAPDRSGRLHPVQPWSRAAWFAGLSGHAQPVPLVVRRMFAPAADPGGAQIKVGVGVIIPDQRGRLLLEQRSDCGWWGLVGGGVDAGESLAQAVAREVFEETGLHVEITRLLGVYSEPAGRIVAYPDNGDLRHLIDVIVVARVLSGRLRKSAESRRLAYFAPARLPSRLVPSMVPALRDYLSGGGGGGFVR
jgi:ADP-ribose pyrophosphatase YjhB (NUDIX family)